jgi:hypothetical protein
MSDPVQLRNNKPAKPRVTERGLAWLKALHAGPRRVRIEDSVEKRFVAIGLTERALVKGNELIGHAAAGRRYGSLDRAKAEGWHDYGHHQLTQAGRTVVEDRINKEQTKEAITARYRERRLDPVPAPEPELEPAPELQVELQPELLPEIPVLEKPPEARTRDLLMCAEEELRRRNKSYPEMVRKRWRTQAWADHEKWLMSQIVELLNRIEFGE